MPIPTTTRTTSALPEQPLRAFRLRAGVSLSEMASMIGTSYTNLAAMERGHRPVSLAVLHAIRRLGFDADTLETQCEDWTTQRNALVAQELRSARAARP